VKTNKIFISLLLASLSLFFISEVTHIESKLDKQLLKQAVFLSKNYKISEKDAYEVVSTVKELTKHTSIESSMIYAIIENESKFQVNAVNKESKALGLMQIHKSSGFKLLENSPENNIIAGVNILNNFHKVFGNYEKATKAFYCGYKIERDTCKDYLKRIQSNQVKFKDWV